MSVIFGDFRKWCNESVDAVPVGWWERDSSVAECKTHDWMTAGLSGWVSGAEQEHLLSKAHWSVVTRWMGDCYVPGFAPALRFLQCQILCRLYKSPSDETINWGPQCGSASKKITYTRCGSSGLWKQQNNPACTKVSESSSCWSWILHKRGSPTGKKFFSRVNFLCTLIWVSISPLCYHSSI